MCNLKQNVLYLVWLVLLIKNAVHVIKIKQFQMKISYRMDNVFKNAKMDIFLRIIYVLNVKVIALNAVIYKFVFYVHQIWNSKETHVNRIVIVDISQVHYKLVIYVVIIVKFVQIRQNVQIVILIIIYFIMHVLINVQLMFILKIKQNGYVNHVLKDVRNVIITVHVYHVHQGILSIFKIVILINV